MSDFQLVRLEFHETDASAGFAGWLADEGVSVAFTSAPRLFFAGLRPDGRLALTDRQYGPCSALVAAGPDTLFLATRFQVWRLENALPAGTLTDDGHDRLFVPQMAWTTGLLGVHDIAVGAGGEPLFVNGRFSCLSRPHERLNFEPVWLPPFVSALSPDDRCHLTGVAVDDTGHPAYVTCAAPTDAANGWRDHQRDGGVVVDVASGEIVCAGLSLPHSPRLRDGRLWLANAGEGQFGYVDLAAGLGRFEPVASVPGFARGVGLHGRFAVVGASRPPRDESFEGLGLADRGVDPVCGIFVVDLEAGAVAHSLVLRGSAPEVQDLAVLPGTRSAGAVAIQGDDVQELVTLPR